MNKFLSSLPHKKFSLFCLTLIAGSIVLKLFFMTAPAMPRDDDLYYWLWFQHPFFSYPDHPPLIALLVGMPTYIFGHSVLSLYLGGFLLCLFLTLLSYFLAKNLFSPPSHLAGILLATTIAIVPYLAGTSVIMTPDTPMTFFIFLALFAYHHAFFKDPNSLAAWLVAGTLLALAFFSKLTVFFIGATIFLYPFASKNRRSLLSNYRFYFSFLPSVIIGIVLLISDASHDWLMLKYTSLRGNRPYATGYIKFIYTQFKLYSPYFFFLFFSVSLVTIKKYYFPKKNQSPASELLFFFSFLTLSLLLVGLGKRYFNHMHSWWVAFATLPGFIMVLYYLVENWHKKRARIFTILNFSWCFFYLSLILFHTYFGVIDYHYKPPKDEHPIVATYNTILRESALLSKKLINQNIEDGIDNFYLVQPLKDGSIKDYFANHLDKDTIVLAGNYRQMAYAKFFNTFPNEIFSITYENFNPKLKKFHVDSYSLSDLLFDSKTLIGKDIYFLFGVRNGIELYTFRNNPYALKNRLKKALSKACGEFIELKSFRAHRKTKLITVTFLFHCKNYNGGEAAADE